MRAGSADTLHAVARMLANEDMLSHIRLVALATKAFGKQHGATAHEMRAPESNCRFHSEWACWYSLGARVILVWVLGHACVEQAFCLRQVWNLGRAVGWVRRRTSIFQSWLSQAVFRPEIGRADSERLLFLGEPLHVAVSADR